MTAVDLARALRLYLVADPEHCGGDILAATRAALAGGVTMVQLRAKVLTDREMVALGVQLRTLTREYDVPLLINDRVDVALAVDADGVHLGVHDVSPADVRHITPHGFIIGYSPDDELDPAGEDADYLGIGPVFGSRSKSDAGDALGIDRFTRRIAQSSVPVVGIGGISARNARQVIEAGAAGVAVISAILGAPDPGDAARRMLLSIS